MLKIGIIGTGYWGMHHLRIFSRLKCDLVGISDIDPTKATLAKEFKVKYFANYIKLLKKVDAVSIVTPPSTHFKIAKKALKRGKHVFVEKPFVLVKREAKELIDLAKFEKRKLMVGHIYLFHPAILELRKVIKNGELGKIYYIFSQRLNLGIVRSDVDSLWNFAPHDLSILLFLLDKKPSSVICVGQAYLRKNIADVTLLTLKFDDKILSHIALSWLHPAKIRQLTVVGSKKMALFDDTDINTPLKIFDKGVDVQKSDSEWRSFGEFKMITRSGEITEPVLDRIEPLEAELSYFLESIKTNTINASGNEIGFEVLSILEAASKSLKKGGREIEIEY